LLVTGGRARLVFCLLKEKLFRCIGYEKGERRRWNLGECLRLQGRKRKVRGSSLERGDLSDKVAGEESEGQRSCSQNRGEGEIN